jgi:uncharacterized LabA/DUF88 family protein
MHLLYGNYFKVFYKDERLAVFIDGPHFMSAASALEMDIDYKLLRDSFAKRGKLLRISHYHPVRGHNELMPIRPLLDWLQYNGFDVVTKPIREFTDEAGVTRRKGNLDVEIAVDAMTIAEKVDHIILVAGSGDLSHLVQNLRTKGVRVSVISTLRGPAAMVSDNLRRLADNFIELASLENSICKAGPAAR